MKLPHTIRYTNSIATGDQFLFRIRINPSLKDNEGLHAHEYEHIKQWYKLTFLFSMLAMGLSVSYSGVALILFPFAICAHGIAYRWITAYRQQCEVEAFREQLKYDTTESDLDFYAEALFNDYNLDISYEKAKQLLTE